MSDDTDDSGDSETADQPERTDASHTTVRHNWTPSDQPSVTIVEAVAAATDRPVTVLPPLQDDLDSEALDTLLRGPASVTVSFRYAGTTVSVSGEGHIEIRLD